MNFEIYEILEKAGSAETKADKIAFLKKHDCLGLRDILRGAYDDTIEWQLPKGAPEFKSGVSKEGMSPTTLKRQSKHLGYFCKGGPGDSLMPVKRERMFLQILEGIHPKDADLLIAMKDKKLAGRYKGITKALVQEVWPNLIAK